MFFTDRMDFCIEAPLMYREEIRANADSLCLSLDADHGAFVQSNAGMFLSAPYFCAAAFTMGESMLSSA